MEALPTIILAAAFGWGSTKLTESSIDSFLDWLEALDGGRAQQWLLLAAVVLTWGFSAIGTLPVLVWQLGFFLQYLAGVVAPRPTTLFLAAGAALLQSAALISKGLPEGSFWQQAPAVAAFGAMLALAGCASSWILRQALRKR